MSSTALVRKAGINADVVAERGDTNRSLGMAALTDEAGLGRENSSDTE